MSTSLVPSAYPFGTFSLPLFFLWDTLFFSFCLTVSYLLVAIFVPSDCPFLWYHLPIHCYLLITSLVPSGYPIWYLLANRFATFCLPVCYLLVASLVPSDNPLVPSGYLFGTFCLPRWYLLITPLVDLIWFWWLTPLSTIFQLYHGNQLYWWKNPVYPERTTNHGWATGNLYQLRLRVECTFFSNWQSRSRTHAVLVICLCELLGNPTT